MAHSPLNREGILTPEEAERRQFIRIQLQDGHVKEVGVNGCFLQDVIEWCLEAIDQFEDEKPQTRCRENSLAKTELEQAWLWLELRRMSRARAGVLGTDDAVPSVRPADQAPAIRGF